MKLLLDQNLSPWLVDRLADLFPNSSHVMAVGLDQSLDREVWAYARQHNYLIVTKDVDFSELIVLRGFPLLEPSATAVSEAESVLEQLRRLGRN